MTIGPVYVCPARVVPHIIYSRRWFPLRNNWRSLWVYTCTSTFNIHTHIRALAWEIEGEFVHVSIGYTGEACCVRAMLLHAPMCLDIQVQMEHDFGNSKFNLYGARRKLFRGVVWILCSSWDFERFPLEYRRESTWCCSTRLEYTKWEEGYRTLLCSFVRSTCVQWFSEKSSSYESNSKKRLTVLHDYFRSSMPIFAQFFNKTNW